MEYVIALLGKEFKACTCIACYRCTVLIPSLVPNSGRDRVECTIAGPAGAQDPSPGSFSNQIIDVLRANNFSIPETEIYSCDI